MRLTVLAIALMAVSSAAIAGPGDVPPPEAYIDPIDQQIARTHSGVPGRPVPCARETIEDGIELIVGTPTEQCVRMLPQRSWRGLWRNDFEGSRFCPEPATECTFDSRGEQIWLDIREGAARRFGGLYQVEFMGWRTTYKGPYGHLGMSDHEIIVDRMLSIREIEPPPPEPTEAEFMESLIAAEATGQFIPSPEAKERMKRYKEQRRQKR